jgi:riboflavin synthase
MGESVAINGVCLTVVEQAPGRFMADASMETLRVTSLGQLALGGKLNLERALCLGDRLGGHLVSGHVDGMGSVISLTPSGAAVSVRFKVPDELRVYIAPKGSISIDGVSLTVNQVYTDGFDVMLIPHTRAITTLGQLVPAVRVNLEVDLLARYVLRCLQFGSPGTGGSETLADALKRSGMM